LLFFSKVLTSQTLTYQSFDQKSGLKSMDIHCIIQDRYGYVWIGSDKGLSMWDSKNFTHFTVEDGLENYNVFKIYYDRQGRLWIVSFSKKLCYYSYKDKKIYNSSRVKYLDKINVELNTDLIFKDNKLYYFSEDRCINFYDFKENKIKFYKPFKISSSLYVFNNKLIFIDKIIENNCDKFYLNDNSHLESIDGFLKDYRYAYILRKNIEVHDFIKNISFTTKNSRLFNFFKFDSIVFYNNQLFYNNLTENNVKRIDIISKNLCFFVKNKKLNLLLGKNIESISNKEIKYFKKIGKDNYSLNEENVLSKNDQISFELNTKNEIFYNTQYY
jgi:hypothetical protein